MPDNYVFLCRCGRDRARKSTTCGNDDCAYSRFARMTPAEQDTLLAQARRWLIEIGHPWFSSDLVVRVLDKVYPGGFPQFYTDATPVVVLVHIRAYNLPLDVAKSLDALVDAMLDDRAWLALAELLSPPCQNTSQAGRPRNPQDN